MITLKELDSVSAFKELSDAHLEALKEFCIKEKFKKGHDIMHSW